jgi:uncharacterized membrane protein YccC
MMPTLLAAALAFLALGAFALAMPKHFEQAWQREPTARQRAALRLAGGLLLAAAAAACLRAEGVALGIVLWCAVLTPAGWGAALLLTYAPRHVPLVLGVFALLVSGAWGALG